MRRRLGSVLKHRNPRLWLAAPAMGEPKSRAAPASEAVGRGVLAVARSVALVVWAACPAVGAEPAPVKDLQAVVTTVDDEQISAKIVGLAEGRLMLDGEPRRTVDLADVQRVELGKLLQQASSSDLVWIGQDNHDLVQVGGAAGGNAIQDLHLQIHNLPSVALKQVVAVCRFPGQLRVWRLDTSQSPHWRLAVARAALAPDADMFLEPASIDSFGMTFDLTFTFADGMSSKASVQANTHTSDQTKIDRAVEPGQPSGAVGTPAPVSKAELILADGG